MRATTVILLALAACSDGETETVPRAELAGIPIDQAVPNEAPAPAPGILAAGAQAYRVHCAVCHGAEGRGNGPVIARGFAEPAPFPAGLAPARTVRIIEEGFGAMQPQGGSVPFEERWAIAYHVERLGG